MPKADGGTSVQAERSPHVSPAENRTGPKARGKARARNEERKARRQAEDRVRAKDRPKEGETRGVRALLH